jgi:hypothetical protein
MTAVGRCRHVPLDIYSARRVRTGAMMAAMRRISGLLSVSLQKRDGIASRRPCSGVDLIGFGLHFFISLKSMLSLGDSPYDFLRFHKLFLLPF